MRRYDAVRVLAGLPQDKFLAALEAKCDSKPQPVQVTFFVSEKLDAIARLCVGDSDEPGTLCMWWKQCFRVRNAEWSSVAGGWACTVLFSTRNVNAGQRYSDVTVADSTTILLSCRLILGRRRT